MPATADAHFMTSEHDEAHPGRSPSAMVLDDLIGALYRDLAEWDSDLTVIHPYGRVVVKRSVGRLVDSHVDRLRESLAVEPTSSRPQETAMPTTPTIELAHQPGHTPIARLNAWFFDRVDRYSNFISRHHKRAAFGGIPPGEVLEIGAGTGANFAYLPKGVVYTALEPSTAMHQRLRRRADAHGIKVRLLTASAEEIPLPDSSIDTVILTLVLCTVTDQATVLAEVLRVLRPGGTMRFVEHVVAPSRWSPRRLLQRVITRPWAWLFEGCQLLRDTAGAIHDADFSSVEIHGRRLGQSVFVPVNSAIYGIAIK